jgi:RNA polymerase sigma factor (sigma-70 family)
MESTFCDRVAPLVGAGRPTPEELCAQCASQVYRFAALVSEGNVEAEDLAHDALVRAIERLHQYDPARGPLEAWLWRIVVNVARDAGRGMKRRQALLERIRSRAPANLVLEQDVAIALGDDDLVAAIRALDSRARTLISLRFGADLDYRAIGGALGLSPAAARVATQRALNTLRARLQTEGEQR